MYKGEDSPLKSPNSLPVFNFQFMTTIAKEVSMSKGPATDEKGTMGQVRPDTFTHVESREQ